MISPVVRKNRVESILKACRLLLRMLRSRPGARKSDILYYQMMSTYCERLLHAREENGFVAAHCVFFPSEVLYAMDIIPMHTESICWMAALFTGESADMLAAGAEVGLASEICSAHRGLAGAYALGVLPHPDVHLWSNLVCDNTSKSGELLMAINKVPGFFLDRPFQMRTDEQEYMVGELKDLIGFLEEKSGHRMDWDRLSEMVCQIDRQVELYREIGELRKAVPSPFHQQGFMQLLTSSYLFPGQPEATEYLETVRRELSDMVQAGKGAVPKERFRLMTLFMPPIYRLGLLEKIGQEFGALSVAEPFFTRWGDGRLDAARPLESIAKHSVMNPEVCSMYGPLTDDTLRMITGTAQEYKVDGAVYYANAGCRHSCATVKVFRDALAEIDVPMLTFDCDILDPTYNTEEEMREKLQQFFELLENR